MRFLKDLLRFLLPLFVLALGVELGLRRVDTMHFSRAIALSQQWPQTRVLITGNSHEAVGIDCRSLGAPCFNLASGSQSLQLDRRMLEKYGGQFSGLKLLILGVSYQSIQAAPREPDDLAFEYWHAYGVDGEDDLPWLDVRRYSVFATFGPERSLDYMRRGFKSGTPVPAPWAYLPAQAIVSRDMTEQGAARRVARHHSGMDPREVPRNLEALRGMIRRGQSVGARVVLLVSPVSSRYRRYTRPADVALLHESVSGLASEMSVELKSYWGDPRFTDELFRDLDHLAPDGTQLLTRLVRAEVVQAGPQGRSLGQP
ncbi:MAG TPA: hypothetical protein VEQ59_25285 [Polyangiaceae bacterium]|nr:hypothetical protein [Polyangiaceae bacterium]